MAAERSAVNTYTVRSTSGAELRIGALGAEGAFSPVELLQATSTVTAMFNADDNRVEKLITTIAADTSELSPEKHDKLVASAERIIDKLCTVKRSLSAGVDPITAVTSLESVV